MSAAQAFGVLLLVPVVWILFTTPWRDILDMHRPTDSDRRVRDELADRRRQTVAREWTRTGR